MMHKFLTNNTLTALLLGLVIVTACVLVLNLAFQSTMDGIDWQEELYNVKSGDTLWSIAGRHCPDTVDRREWISEVKAINGLTDSNIYSGQALIILTTEEG